MAFYGCIEAGGTKFLCAISDEEGALVAETKVKTTTPRETLTACSAFFTEQAKRVRLAAIGIAAFGPLDLRPHSPTWGYITTTPKLPWQQVDLAGHFRRKHKVPVGLDTDVNGAAMAEALWGAGRGLRDLVYITVGAGIGGGALVHGEPIHGVMHPEMGHMRIPHDLLEDPFEGCCPFHGDCLEGLASGTAMEKRWGVPPAELPDDHPGWELEARYLALGVLCVVTVLSPQRVVLGGGVVQRPHTLPRIREHLASLLNRYIQVPEVCDSLDTYLVAPGLGHRSGLMGGLALARAAEKRAASR